LVGGRRIYSEERRGNTRRSHEEEKVGFGEEIRRRKEKV
jgi:hypothetical protein